VTEQQAAMKAAKESGVVDVMGDYLKAGGEIDVAGKWQPPANSPAGLLATIYRSNYRDDDPTPAEQIDAIRRLRERLDEEEQQIVFGLRLHGTSWQAIGDMFGISRQAAHERFRAAATIDKMAIAGGKEPKP
jgi:DNA-directed RNA polymerase specialized sigma24 family protein